MGAIHDLNSNSKESLTKIIEREHPKRTAKLFLFLAGSGKWRVATESSLRPNHNVVGVLYPNGDYQSINLKKINGTIKMMEKGKWITWEEKK